MKNLILLSIISLVLLVSVNAATVSHPASEITAGTFGAGDYTFPNNLVVAGIIQVGSFSTKPTCNTNTIGAFVFDTTANKPYVCASGGWKPLDSDNDKDGLVDWLDPNDNSFNPQCTADNGGQCYLSQGSKSSLDGDLSTGNIKKNVNIFGISGTYSGPPNCVVDNGGNCQIATGSKSGLDGDLTSSNIKQGVTIFGITGSLSEGSTLAAAAAVRNRGQCARCYSIDPFPTKRCVWWGGRRCYTASQGAGSWDPQGIIQYGGSTITLHNCLRSDCSGNQVVSSSGGLSCGGGYSSGAGVVASAFRVACEKASASSSCSAIACVK